MDLLPHEAPDQRCPHCGAWLTGDDPAAHCPFCDGELVRGDRSRRQHPALKALVRLAGSYRIWSLLIFFGAFIDLIRVGDGRSLYIGFFVLMPMIPALLLASWARNPWLIAFLLLVDLGVILAPAHQILPWLNLVPWIPRTQNRVISWYLLVYFTLQFGVAPPIMLGRSLRTAWRGGMPAIAPWICIFGLAVWGLLMSIVTLCVLTT